MDHSTSPVLIRALDAERLSAGGAFGAEAPSGWVGVHAGEGGRWRPMLGDPHPLTLIPGRVREA